MRLFLYVLGFGVDVRGKVMADNQTLNYYQPAARTSVVRTTRTDWLQAWLSGETPDSLTLEQQGFQAHLYYAVVIYRDSGEALGGAQFAALLQGEANRRGINGPVLAH